MPSKSQTIPVTGADIDTILAISYGTIIKLGWEAKYAGEEKLIANTPKSFTKWNDEILAEASPGLLTVTSSLVHGESFDMLKKNKKHLLEFEKAFDIVREAGEQELAGYKEAIEHLRKQTRVAAEEEIKKTQEADAVMHLSTGTKTITYSIIGINVLVFIAMAIAGVNAFEPEIDGLIKFGASYGPLTLGGQWWRLVTNIFVHIGIVHIVANMIALFYIGMFLEPLLGKAKYAIGYLCTGITASIASVWWHGDTTVSAGASGAIFGLYGIFLALLLTNLIPKQMRKGLLQSIGIFVIYNLAYGMKSGVDNAAHVGGLLSGFLVGFLYYFDLKPGVKANKITAPALTLVATLVITFFYLRNNQNENAAFTETMKQFGQKEEMALSPLQHAESMTENKLIDSVRLVTLPSWQECKRLLQQTENMKLNESYSKKRELLNRYIDLRITEANMITTQEDSLNTGLKEAFKQNEEKLKEVLEELNHRE